MLVPFFSFYKEKLRGTESLLSLRRQGNLKQILLSAGSGVIRGKKKSDSTSPYTILREEGRTENWIGLSYPLFP